MADLKIYKGKKVFITGHTGFKGAWLSQTILHLGGKVIGYSLEPPTIPSLFETLGLKEKITHYTEDIRNIQKLTEVLKKEKPDIVFHLAAQAIVRVGYDDPITTFHTNALGTANLLQAMKETGTKAGVLITTDKVYKNKESDEGYKESDELGGHDPYSASKACAEIIISSYNSSFFKASDIRVASTRAGNVIGGGDWAADRLIPDIVRSIVDRGETLEIRNPNSIRPWQHVLEPLTGYLLLGKKLLEGNKDFCESWNFAPLEKNAVTVEEITKTAVEILGKGTYKINAPNDGKHETSVLKLNAEKAMDKLGWKPHLEIKEMLSLTFEWYKAYYEQKDMTTITNNQISDFLEK